MVGGIVVMLVTIAVAGCGERDGDIAGRVRRARTALRQNLGLVQLECAMDFARADRTQDDVKQLVRICEHDLPLAWAKDSLDFVPTWMKNGGHAGGPCSEAKKSLNALDDREPEVKQMRARWHEVCGAMALEMPEAKPAPPTPAAESQSTP